MTVAALAQPASADTVYKFVSSSSYSDGQSSRSGRSNLGATDIRKPQRAERKASRKSRSARVRDVDRSERRRASSRRGTRVASLGNDVGVSRSGRGGGGGGHHGVASYYWQPQRVASGGWFNPNAMTAAHKTLPFGTRVRVTHAGNGRSVVVKINDRGPYVRGRIIDLSKAAAGVIGMHGQGIAQVRMEVLGR
ncbi:MAG: septal ring lytic transglycosylase RlpA family protein [Hyphomicrobium sp.]|nr:septal ring lytic transglycosylase RlpA family protein [Hyphomicrobium sp.]MBN9266975.1 septal ring lytic transglycosylase RlpA family protein [Hyphomicrobium sp.]MBN9276479.1 septal ring lytic transglycosylase RlpA family protein [Hyphomicrobium sp.]